MLTSAAPAAARGVLAAKQTRRPEWDGASQPPSAGITQIRFRGRWRSAILSAWSSQAPPTLWSCHEHYTMPFYPARVMLHARAPRYRSGRVAASTSRSALSPREPAGPPRVRQHPGERGRRQDEVARVLRRGDAEVFPVRARHLERTTGGLKHKRGRQRVRHGAHRRREGRQREEGGGERLEQEDHAPRERLNARPDLEDHAEEHEPHRPGKHREVRKEAHEVCETHLQHVEVEPP